MEIVKNEAGEYLIRDGTSLVPAARVTANPFHSRNAYLAFLTEDTALLSDSSILSLIRKAEGRPLQVTITAEQTALIRLLERSGFRTVRRCYEMSVTQSDLRISFGSEAFPLLCAKRPEAAYDACCQLLYRHYRKTHEQVSPLTASVEAFCSRLPETVYYTSENGRILHGGFTEDNELAYVCSEDAGTFPAFLRALLQIQFEQYDTLTFEADDTDPEAMLLKHQFSCRELAEYDTYILP